MRKLFSKSNEPEIQFFKKNIPSTDYRPLQPKKKEENDRRGKERHMLMTQFIQMTKFSVSFFSFFVVCLSFVSRIRSFHLSSRGDWAKKKETEQLDSKQKVEWRAAHEKGVITDVQTVLASVLEPTTRLQTLFLCLFI